MSEGNFNPVTPEGSGVYPNRYILVPVKSGMWKTLLWIMLFFFLLFSLTCNMAFISLLSDSLTSKTSKTVEEEFYSGDESSDEKIAIIDVTGTIEDGEDYRDIIEEAAKDEKVKIVILRVDSPGGTVTGSDYILNKLNLLRVRTNKQIIVSMGSLACSGGYYISMCVGNVGDSIFIEPTGWTGSIGVILSRYDASELFNKKLGVFEDPITSGPNKAMGSPLMPLTEEQRKIFQDLVDDSFNRFKEIIKQGRPRFAKNPKELDDLATGQVYSANQALKLGLVDKIGFLDDAIAEACARISVDPEKAHVFRYKHKSSWHDALFSKFNGSSVNSSPVEDVQKVINKATSPKAYYLWQM